MNASQVQNQLIINIQPEIVVPGELKDDVVSPRVQAVFGLGKVRGHLHAEEIICCRFGNLMKTFPIARVIFRKRYFVQIHRIAVHLRVRPGLVGRRIDQRIKGHELSMHRRFNISRSLNGCQLIKHFEAVTDEMCEILCGIVFKVSALIIDALDKETVYRMKLCPRIS